MQISLSISIERGNSQQLLNQKLASLGRISKQITHSLRFWLGIRAMKGTRDLIWREEYLLRGRGSHPCTAHRTRAPLIISCPTWVHLLRTLLWWLQMSNTQKVEFHGSSIVMQPALLRMRDSSQRRGKRKTYRQSIYRLDHCQIKPIPRLLWTKLVSFPQRLKWTGTKDQRLLLWQGVVLISTRLDSLAILSSGRVLSWGSQQGLSHLLRISTSTMHKSILLQRYSSSSVPISPHLMDKIDSMTAGR